jgi:hypothetical protein
VSTFRQVHGTITLAEYRQLALTRPLTDEPIGATSTPKRHRDAEASAVHTEPDTTIPSDTLVRLSERRKRYAALQTAINLKNAQETPT